MNPEIRQNPVASEPVRVAPLVVMSARDLVGTIVTGLVVGLVTLGAAIVLNRFVFSAVLCRTSTEGDCVNAPSYAIVVAVVLGVIVGTVALARLRVYRPIIVVLASAITLWGIFGLLLGVSWYWALAISAVLHSIAYGMFAWVVRLRSFILALIITVVLVVGFRLLIQR